MWRGEGAGKLVVPGRFYASGTVSIGFQATPKIKATIDIPADVMLDWKPKNGKYQPIGEIDGVDFVMLAYGTLSQNAGIEFATNKHTYSIDLTGLMPLSPAASMDVHVMVNGDFVELQFASGVDIKLQDLCNMSPALSFVCKIFD